MNTVNHFFGNEAYSLNVSGKGRGRNISAETIKKRIECVKEFLFTSVTLEEMGIDKSGTFYSRDKATFLCRLAYYVYQSLYVSLLKSPEHEAKRNSVIKEIEGLMLKYTILPCELSLPIKHDPVSCSLIKGEGLSEIDAHLKKFKALRKLLSSTFPS